MATKQPACCGRLHAQLERNRADLRRVARICAGPRPRPNLEAKIPELKASIERSKRNLEDHEAECQAQLVTL